MKKKLCQFFLACFLGAVTIVTLGSSFLAVHQVSIFSIWSPLDYWYAWYAGVSFIAGIIGSIVAVVAFATFFDGLCE